MTARLEAQRALLGGIIVRRAAARVRKIVREEHFDGAADRAVFAAAMRLAAIGLDDSDEYVLRIAQYLTHEDREPMYLRGLMEAFEREADARPGSRLEDLAREVAAQRFGKASGA